MRNGLDSKMYYPSQQVGKCEHPIMVTNPETGEVNYARCGSRRKCVCKSCSALAKKDYQKLIQGGFTEVDASKFVFYFLTLTAPSFGKTHFVPKVGRPTRKCRCGSVHDPIRDRGLRGVPLDFADYDYLGCIEWNNHVGKLWDSTRARLQTVLPYFSYAKVYEFQERGALHLHAILRMPVTECIDPDRLRDIARSTVMRDGMAWGMSADCKRIQQVSDRDSFVRYMAKMLVYVTKDSAGSSREISDSQKRHFWLLDMAAQRRFHCDKCRQMKRPCRAVSHRRWGARSSVLSKSRGSKSHLAWSSLRRIDLKARRVEFAKAMAKAELAFQALKAEGWDVADEGKGRFIVAFRK